MDDGINLPFKEGQLAESKSFLEGYRGAWFKCKIKSISRRNKRLGHVLEYLDFPGEKLKWELLYQTACHHEGDTKGKHRELMLRPSYPPIYNEKKPPHVSEISEVAVIVGDSWRVGDLVDWWTTHCYWSGTITQLLGPNKAEIKLRPPPLGEGSSYEAFFKDLRPSLDWSPELGWTIPTQEGASGPCARLIKPINQDSVAEGVQRHAGLLFPSPARSETTATQTQTVSEEQNEKQERNGSQRTVNSIKRKTSQAVADSGQNRAEVKSRTTETQTQTVSEKQDCSTRKRSWVVADSCQNGAEVESRTMEMQTQTVFKKQKDKQVSNAGQGPVNSSIRKLSRVFTDSGLDGAGKSRTRELQTPTASRKQGKQETNAGQGPVDSMIRIVSPVVTDSGQDGAEVKSGTMELQTETVSVKQDKQERRTSRGPVDSSSRNKSQVIADSGQNVEVKSRTEMQTQETHCMGKTVSKTQKDRQERSSSQYVDSCPRKTNLFVVNSGQNGAQPAAGEELNPEFCQKKYRAILNSKRSDTLEAVILDLEECVNKVKWLKKILQYGVASSEEGPQWTFMEPLAAIQTTK